MVNQPFNSTLILKIKRWVFTVNALGVGAALRKLILFLMF